MSELITPVVAHGLALVSAVGLFGLFLIFVTKGAIVGNVFPTSVFLPGYVLAVGASYREAAVIVAVVTLAHIVGQLFIYAGVRLYGPSFLSRVPFLSPDADGSRFARLERWFQAHAGLTVFLSSVIPWTRGLVAIPAGLEGYSTGRFTAHVTVATLLYHSIYVAAAVAGIAAFA